MTGNDTLLLVITSGIASQFEDLSGEVLEDGSEVNCIAETRNESAAPHWEPR